MGRFRRRRIERGLAAKEGGQPEIAVDVRVGRGNSGQITAAGILLQFSSNERRPSRVAHDETSLFAGRDRIELLQSRVAWMEARHRANRSCALLIGGVPGAGKTAYASELMRRLRSTYAGNQIWVSVDLEQEASDVSRLVRNALVQLDGSGDVSTFTDQDAVNRLRSLLGEEALLVIDNVVSDDQVVAFRDVLPPRSALIITSRVRLDALATSVDCARDDLGPLSATDAIEIFRDAAPNAEGGARSADDEESLERMLEASGRIVLGVRVAAALLHRYPTLTLATLMGSDRRGWSVQTAHLPGEVGRSQDNTIRISASLLDDAQARAFALLGELPRPGCTASAFAALLDAGPAEAHTIASELERHFLARIEPAGLTSTRLELHDVIVSVARETDVPTSEREAAATRLLAYYVDASQAIAERLELTTQPHAENASTQARADARIFDGDSREANALFDKLARDQRHSEAALLGESLGTIHCHNGRYDIAESVLRRTAAILERVTPVDELRFRRVQFNLAFALRNAGRPEDAALVEESVLKSRERLLGNEHPATLEAEAMLGLDLWSAGHSAQARRHFDRVLAVRTRTLGPDHPDTLATEANLALLYWDDGEGERAARYLADIWVRRREVLGADHIDTLITRHNLGVSLRRLGQPAEAEAMHADVADARTRVLGEHHPHTLMSQHNRAIALFDLGRIQEAGELLARVLEERREILGPQHPDTLRSAHWLGLALARLGDSEAGTLLLNEVLAQRVSQLGIEHPDSVETAQALADLSVACTRTRRKRSLWRLR